MSRRHLWICMRVHASPGAPGVTSPQPTLLALSAGSPGASTPNVACNQFSKALFCPLFGRLRCFFPHPPPAAIGADPRLQAPASARSATSPEAASPARAVPITARPLWCPADSEIRVFICIGISTPGVWLLCHFYRPPLECRGTQNNLGRRSILGAEVPNGPGFAHSSNQCHIMDGVDCLHPFCC